MMPGLLPVTDPAAVAAILLTIEAAVLVAADTKYIRGAMKYIPPMFWIYFLPMLAATLGVLTPEKDQAGEVAASVYGQIGAYCLPASLVLLLLSADIPGILRLGGMALGVMLAGSLGVLLGGPLVLMLYRPLVPAGVRQAIWSGFGCLSGSWIGGSANMLTVAKGIETPGEVYSLMVIVDTVCPYAWMCLLVILSRFQAAYDRLSGAARTPRRGPPGAPSRTEVLRDLAARSQAGQATYAPLTLKHLSAMVAIAGGGTIVARNIASMLPGVPNMLNSRAWTLILATAIGAGLSFTPARRLEAHGASKLGYALLYLVLASIGACTTLKHLGAAPILILAGFTWIGIHAAFIVAAGRLLRAPMALLATASQANIGGPASAPVLAEAYLPGLAPVGLLLAVLGNILGTYMGFACAWLCRLVGEG